MIITSLMNKKSGLIIGVANINSLAWNITCNVLNQGAVVALTYYSSINKKRILSLLKNINISIVLPCDVSNDEEIKYVFKVLKYRWGVLDFLLHSISYVNNKGLQGKYLTISRRSFIRALDINCFSFTTISRYASYIMNFGGSILTLTYFGAKSVIPFYNVMGVAKSALEASVRYLANDLGCYNIRVNALSLGPVKTLSSLKIREFNSILNYYKLITPMYRNITFSDISGSSIYFLSNLSSGVTGEIHNVDCGYQIMGIKYY